MLNSSVPGDGKNHYWAIPSGNLHRTMGLLWPAIEKNNINWFLNAKSWRKFLFHF